MQIIGTHAEAKMLIGLDGEQEGTIILLTVLTRGVEGAVRAYEAVVQDTSLEHDYVAAFKESVARHGNKISEERARKIFNIEVFKYRR